VHNYSQPTRGRLWHLLPIGYHLVCCGHAPLAHRHQLGLFLGLVRPPAPRNNLAWETHQCTVRVGVPTAPASRQRAGGKRSSIKSLGALLSELLRRRLCDGTTQPRALVELIIKGWNNGEGWMSHRATLIIQKPQASRKGKA